MGVEELHGLHVAHRGGGQFPAAPARHAGGRAAGEPVEDPHPQLGQHPVGQIVRKVHLAPGHQGPDEDQHHESGDRTGRGRAAGGDGRSDGVGGQGHQRDQGALFDDRGGAGAGHHGPVPGERGQQGTQ